MLSNTVLALSRLPGATNPYETAFLACFHSFGKCDLSSNR